eukprot:794967-Prymnesium_polylepis.1
MWAVPMHNKQVQKQERRRGHIPHACSTQGGRQKPPTARPPDRTAAKCPARRTARGSRTRARTHNEPKIKYKRLNLNHPTQGQGAYAIPPDLAQAEAPWIKTRAAAGRCTWAWSGLHALRGAGSQTTVEESSRWCAATEAVHAPARAAL